MFQKLIARIAKELNKLKIPYMVIGGQAVLLYGEPRLTKDIDITLGIGVEDYKKVLDLVSKLDLKVLSDDPERFVKDFMVFPLREEKSNIKIDFIFSFTPYERAAINRSKKVNMENTDINFASVEDIIIHKIFAGRPRDLEDVKTIILKNPKFDKGYVAKCLKEFDETLSCNLTEKFKSIIKTHTL